MMWRIESTTAALQMSLTLSEPPLDEDLHTLPKSKTGATLLFVSPSQPAHME
jgi:hypothetical protein